MVITLGAGDVNRICEKLIGAAAPAAAKARPGRPART